MADQSDIPMPVRETLADPASCDTVILGGDAPEAVRETILPAAVVDAEFGRNNGLDLLGDAPDPGSSSPQGDSPTQDPEPGSSSPQGDSPTPNPQPEPETPPADDAGHEEESA